VAVVNVTRGEEASLANEHWKLIAEVARTVAWKVLCPDKSSRVELIRTFIVAEKKRIFSGSVFRGTEDPDQPNESEHTIRRWIVRFRVRGGWRMFSRSGLAVPTAVRNSDIPFPRFWNHSVLAWRWFEVCSEEVVALPPGFGEAITGCHK